MARRSVPVSLREVAGTWVLGVLGQAEGGQGGMGPVQRWLDGGGCTFARVVGRVANAGAMGRVGRGVAPWLGRMVGLRRSSSGKGILEGNSSRARVRVCVWT